MGFLWDELRRERRIDKTTKRFLTRPSDDDLKKLPKTEKLTIILSALSSAFFFEIQKNDTLWESLELLIHGRLKSWLIPQGSSLEREKVILGIDRGMERFQRIKVLPEDPVILAIFAKDLLPQDGGDPFIKLLQDLSPIQDLPEDAIRVLAKTAEAWGLTFELVDSERDYEILGLNPEVSGVELKQTYRALAAQFHPDTSTGLSDQQREETEEAFLRIKNAYERITRYRKL